MRAGLPREARVSARTALHILEQAGIGAGWVQRDLDDLLSLVFPAAILLRNGGAFIVLERAGHGEDAMYHVLLPDAGDGGVLLESAKLKELYAGYALLAKPHPRLDDRAGPPQPQRTGHWLFSTLWNYRRYYVSAALSALLINVLTLASTFFTMNVYDRVVPNEAYATLWSMAIGVCLAMIFEFVARHVRSHLVDIAGKKADLLLGAVLFRKLLATRMEFKPQSAGSSANQLREFESVRDFVTSATVSTLSDLPFTLLFVGIIFLIGGPLALVPAMAIPLIIGLSVAIQWPLARVMSENLREGSLKQGLLIESIEGLESLKAAQGEGVMQHKWESFSALSAASALKSRMLSSLAMNSVTLIQQLQTVVLVVWGVYLIHAGELTMGALFGTVMLAGRATSPLAALVGLALRFQQAKTALASLSRIMDQPEERELDRHYLSKPKFDGRITLKRLEFSYPAPPMQQAPKVLQGINLDFQVGERVALLGSIGCGKSTLLRIVAAMYSPTSGQVLMDGIDIAQIDPADVRAAIGLMVQEPRLFHGSLRENIIIGDPSASTDEMLRVARLTGLDAIAARHPRGFDMPIGEGGQGLSGGQKQLVALARCLVLKPRILLMDEPTSSMDMQTERFFLEKMAEATRGQTLIVATHRLSVLELVDRIVVLDADDNQPSLVIEGYFAQLEPVAVYGLGEDGQMHMYVRSNGEGGIFTLSDGATEPVALSSEPYGPADQSDGEFLGGFFPILLAGGLGLLGVAALASSESSATPSPAPTPPAADSVGAALDDEGSQTGPIQPGGVTDDTQPELSGRGTPGDIVTVYDDGKKLGEVTVKDDGEWTFTPPSPLPDGAHSITVTEKTPDGIEGPPSGSFDFGVDSVPPAKPGPVGNVVDDVGAITGSVAPGGTTDDSRPQFNGIGEPGNTITIYDNGQKIGETTVGGDGTWSYTSPEGSELGEGLHSVTVTESDPAGNVSEPSDPFAFGVDTSAPDKPGIGDGQGLGAVIDDVGSITGSISAGGITDDSKPEFTGNGTPGNTINVLDNGEKIGSAVVGPDGTWSFMPSAGMGDGQHAISITESDPAGNTSDASDAFLFGIDTVAPDAGALAITGVADDVGAITGNVVAGGQTDDTLPVISGTGTAGDTIIVMVQDGAGSREVGRAAVGANGAWQLQVPAGAALGAGNNRFSAIEMDAAGNKTAPSAAYDVVVSTARPQPPVINAVVDNEGEVHNLQKGEVTNDATPTLQGTAQPGATVSLYEGSPQGALLGSVVADSDGNWSVSPAGLADGAHSLVAVAVDAVGQSSDPTGGWNFSVDTGVPAASGGNQVTDNVGEVQGPVADGGTTDDAMPELSGTAEPGSTVTVLDNGEAIGTVQVKPDGSWSFIPEEALGDGDHSITTVVTDPAGNTSAPSAPIELTVNTSDVPVSIGAVTDNVGGVTGNIAPGGVSDDTQPTFNGAGEPGAIVTVRDGQEVLGSTTVLPNGSWSLTPQTPLGEGAHSIVAASVDAAGNPTQTPAFEFSVDAAAPSVPTIGAVSDDVGAVSGQLADGATTDDPSPTLTGQAEPGSTVSVYDNGALLGEVKAAADGSWNFTPERPLGEGAHEFTTTATDAAGNVSAPSDGFALTAARAKTEHEVGGLAVLVTGKAAMQPLKLCLLVLAGGSAFHSDRNLEARMEGKNAPSAPRDEFNQARAFCTPLQAGISSAPRCKRRTSSLVKQKGHERLCRPNCTGGTAPFRDQLAHQGVKTEESRAHD